MAHNKFLVSNYILELSYTTLNIAKITGLTGEMIEIYFYMIDKLCSIIIKNCENLKLEKNHAKSGEF